MLLCFSQRVCFFAAFDVGGNFLQTGDPLGRENMVEVLGLQAEVVNNHVEPSNLQRSNIPRPLPSAFGGLEYIIRQVGTWGIWNSICDFQLDFKLGPPFCHGESFTQQYRLFIRSLVLLFHGKRRRLPAVERVIIDVRGKRRLISAHDERLNTWFGETLVAALKKSRERGDFKSLLKPKNCALGVQDMDTGFAWPKNGRMSRESRAGW